MTLLIGCVSLKDEPRLPTKAAHTVEGINKQIERLEDARDRYLAKAARARDRGDRLQFQDGYLLEARRAWKRAENNRQIAEKIDQKIQELQKRRQHLKQK